MNQLPLGIVDPFQLGFDFSTKERNDELPPNLQAVDDLLSACLPDLRELQKRKEEAHA